MSDPIAPIDPKTSATAAETAWADLHSYGLSVMAAIGPKTLDGGGLEGRVLVAFSVSATGAPLGVRVAQSSGHEHLDLTALRVVGQASFPTPPTALAASRRTYLSAFTFT